MGRAAGSPVQQLLTNLVLEEHLTLEVNWPNGIIGRYAGSTFTAEGKSFQAWILEHSPLRAAAGAVADRIDVTLQNSRFEITRLVAAAAALGLPATAVVGIAHRDHRNPTTWLWTQVLEGIVVWSGGGAGGCQLQVLSDVYAAGNVGGLTPIQASCHYKYRDLETCGYTGNLPSCDFTLTGPNGCEVHDNSHRYGGKLRYKTELEAVSLPTPGSGGDVPGNGEPGPIDGGPGRIFDPSFPLESY